MTMLIKCADTIMENKQVDDALFPHEAKAWRSIPVPFNVYFADIGIGARVELHPEGAPLFEHHGRERPCGNAFSIVRAHLERCRWQWQCRPQRSRVCEVQSLGCTDRKVAELWLAIKVAQKC